MNKTILLIQPDFPIPKKRKIHHDYFPIGLLKIGTYFKNCLGYDVHLIFGNNEIDIVPDEIWITSLFTYWSEYVHESVQYYRALFPNARIVIGGIYATLMPDVLEKVTGCEIHKGIFQPAEKWCKEHGVDYSLLDQPINFQILHGMRGCFRRCEFCGTWRIEPEEIFQEEIHNRIDRNHVVFYDNNMLRNPNIEKNLEELANVKVNGKIVKYESQSGFDGRILNEKIAKLLKEARFINPRIAWDNSYEDWPNIEKQINLLINAGYNRKDIYVFMIYNWKHDFNILEKKRLKCWDWKVQIADCRYRPLNQLYDYYDSRRIQNSSDYHIHPNWTDDEVKQFRKNVRRHNICIRHNFLFYSSSLERLRVSKEMSMKYRQMSKDQVKAIIHDAWFPDEFATIASIQKRLENYSNKTRIELVSDQ